MEVCPPHAALMAWFLSAAIHRALELCGSRSVLRNSSSKGGIALYASNSRKSEGVLNGMRDKSTVCAREGGRQQTKFEQESLLRCIDGTRF